MRRTSLPCFHASFPRSYLRVLCVSTTIVLNAARLVMVASTHSRSHMSTLAPHPPYPTPFLHAGRWTLDRLDFVKIDVQGFEERVVRGAADTLRRLQVFPTFARTNEIVARTCLSLLLRLTRETETWGVALDYSAGLTLFVRILFLACGSADALH